MKIYDISQEVLSCNVYPGDPKPQKKTLSSMQNGDLYNLTSFDMCSHNGTHIDAPFHFIQNGKTVDKIELESVVGMAYVACHNGVLGGKDASEILRKAKEVNVESSKRILIKGNAVVSNEAARIFKAANVLLLGNESQTVGPEDAPMEVHLTLLGADVILLEGINLKEVPEGVYLLNALPLNLAGFDGSPCRAILIDGIKY